ncbi:MAG: peptide-methionine (R)-S-oxide reductase MsrB [Gammaproteobacteria bacterium]|nr:peptide-methionine (R)-S-oxide reductase MsrB [Gammaproteobacteria bacterium]
MGKNTPDDERSRLTSLQYAVTRESATEPAFSGDYVYHKEDGTYRCVCCDCVLFDSDTKYDSGSGWPSFTSPSTSDTVTTTLDTSHGMRRLEVRCSNCDAHLGHVFEDGPGPDSKRYCINSAALNFASKDNSGNSE